MTAILADPSRQQEEIFPWLSRMPNPVQVYVKGNTLHYLDSEHRQHSARVVIKRWKNGK